MHSDVLIIEDEAAIRRLLGSALARSGLSFVEAANAAEGLRHASVPEPPAVALLDLGLPDRDGLEIVPQLAEHGIAVIVLTARDATAEKVAALDLGADDFVTKPFDTEELLARIRSAMRRRAGPAAVANRREFAGGWIDRELHQVMVREKRLELTPREFNLLWLLAERPGRVSTHAALLEKVWGPAHRDDVDYLRVAIRAIRKKVELDPSRPQLVVNEPGVGYRLQTID